MGSRDSDIARGREAMTYFHNKSATYSGYGLTLDQLLDRVAGGGIKNSIFLEGLGMSVRNVEMSSSSLQRAMENLAKAGRGKVPDDRHAFFQALTDEVQDINWIEAAPEIAVDVLKDVAVGVAEGGETVIGILKAANVILPILIIGGFTYIAISRIKKAA